MKRFNGVLNDRLGCLTRKTHAFAKATATWYATVGLLLFEHDWLRPHPAMPLPLAAPIDGRRYHWRTPAMRLGLTNHPWTSHQLLTQPRSHYMME